MARTPRRDTPAEPPSPPNYLIGFGQRLTRKVDRAGRINPDKMPPYTIGESVDRLKAKVATTAQAVAGLAQQACPGGESVALMTLHPEYLAKSYFPKDLMSAVGLRPIGSRSRSIHPEAWSDKSKPADRGPAPAIEMYVAGKRAQFLRWAQELPAWTASHKGASELARIEDVRPLVALDQRLQPPLGSSAKDLYLEVALHNDTSINIVNDFTRYVATLGGVADSDLTIAVRGLVFLPVRIPRVRYQALADYGFLRVARPLTKLRSMPTSLLRASPVRGVYLPPAALPVNPDERVAILDGGLPEDHDLPATSLHDIDVGGVDPRHQDHGLMVTGALLHGPLHEGRVAERPYTAVDHYRVVDAADNHGDAQLFRVLKRIERVFQETDHDVLNLSLGPDTPFEDDEVHVWTSTLDQLAASGRFLTVAAGNNGHLAGPLDRIQVPGDGVNLCCVGAADRRGTDWKRAGYSAVGPGRRPGAVKPDLVAFGGSAVDEFCLLRQHGSGYALAPAEGTSFAAPLVLRAAACLRAHYGSQLNPLTLRALLVHTAQQRDGHPAGDAGWGRIVDERELLVCPPATARIIYQDVLTPKKSMRAAIPMPVGLTGMVTITATICFGSPVSAADPVNYTSHGLEIAFRPNALDIKPDKLTGRMPLHAKTASFFSETYSDYATEAERRGSQYKWETVVHGQQRKQIGKLVEPVFDIHVVPREGLRDADAREPIPYSMVISLHAANHTDIYNRVLQAYSGRLQALAPVRVPLRT